MIGLRRSPVRQGPARALSAPFAFWSRARAFRSPQGSDRAGEKTPGVFDKGENGLWMRRHWLHENPTPGGNLRPCREPAGARHHAHLPVSRADAIRRAGRAGARRRVSYATTRRAPEHFLQNSTGSRPKSACFPGREASESAMSTFRMRLSGGPSWSTRAASSRLARTAFI